MSVFPFLLFFLFPPLPPSPIFQTRASSWIYCFNKTTIILPPLYPPATHLWYHELFHHTVRPELWEHHRASPQMYQRDERWPRQTLVCGSDAWINCLQDLQYGAERAGRSFLLIAVYSTADSDISRLLLCLPLQPPGDINRFSITINAHNRCLRNGSISRVNSFPPLVCPKQAPLNQSISSRIALFLIKSLSEF